MLLDDWQRIEKIVRWTGLSVNSFALSIGLNRSENLYRIKRGDNGISKELAELIAARYPEISRAWIITGEGGMFIGNTEERNLIPAYDIDALTLAGMERFPEASYVLSLPRAEHVTFAALMLNKAMEPEIPVGATLLLSETEESALIPGYPYLVVSDRVTAVRNVFRNPEAGTLRLRAANPAFGDIEVEPYRLRKLFLVRGQIHYNR